MCAPSFTGGLVDPALDPACIYAAVLVDLVAIVDLVVVGDACEVVLEYRDDLVIVVQLPLDSLGRLRLAASKGGHELFTKACRSSEQRRRGVVPRSPMGSLCDVPLDLSAGGGHGGRGRGRWSGQCSVCLAL